ncbi:hypothetical protein CDD81_6243 [Ophiocordyceps australis]|uniref:AB hydrolase-1 domain-containing protein n=1 Tax=Ophiocordyceps australis TaxID=1399860 RepID=A0A2C5Y7F9_9HYPO|nr:hypothetical protein CDD81_6243 [Ophiocordyceps australis]
MLSSIWLPSAPRENARRVLLYLVCGNPGCIGFYGDFAETLRAMLDGHDKQATIAWDIYGRSLLGFGDVEEGQQPPQGLDAQIEAMYSDVAARRDSKGQAYDWVVLMGHSIGAYICLSIMERHARTTTRKANAQDLVLRHGLLLFPTIALLAESSSGRRLALARRLKLSSALAQVVVDAATWLLPRRLLLWLLTLALGMSERAAGVAAEWLASRDGVRQTLHLAGSELDHVGQDGWDSAEALWSLAADSTTPAIFMLYAKRDHWVADSVRDECVAKRGDCARIDIDQGELSHAFCTTERNSWLVAKIVDGWIAEIENGLSQGQ